MSPSFSYRTIQEEELEHSLFEKWQYFDIDGINSRRHFGIDGMDLPENAPDWVQDREKFWQEVQDFESHNDKIIAREFRFNLPSEISQQKQAEMVKGWAKDNITNKGLIADVTVYDDQLGTQGHTAFSSAHILVNTRSIDGNGFGHEISFDEEHIEQMRESYQHHYDRMMEQENNLSEFIDAAQIKAQEAGVCGQSIYEKDNELEP